MGEDGWDDHEHYSVNEASAATAEELELFMEELDRGFGKRLGSKYGVGVQSFRSGCNNKKFSPLLCATMTETDDTSLLDASLASNASGSKRASSPLQSTHYNLTQQIPDDVQLPATAVSLDLDPDDADLESDDQLTTRSSLPSIPAASTPLCRSARHSGRPFHRRPIPKLNDVDQDDPLPVHTCPAGEGYSEQLCS